MQHITGIFRHQMRFSSLEDAIALDNQVLVMLGLVVPESDEKHEKTSLKLLQKKEDYKSSYYSL
jgi:hydrogenase maturation factor